MTRAPDVEVDEAEASLINRLHTKGLLHLGLDEVEAAYRAKALPEKWQRVTGSRMPEQLLVDITERLRRVNRLKSDSTVDPAAPGSGLAFLKAVAAGETGSVRRCLESRDRRRLMDASDEQQRGCVHVAARAGHAEVLTLLFDHGAHMDAKDRFGRTPLHLACEYGRVAAVQILLEAGSQPSNVDKSGRTALHFAACCEDAQICRLLLAQQPSLVHRTDGHGRKSLFYSVLNVHPTGQSEITNLLLEHRCEVNEHDSNSRAPLHYAAEDGRKAAVGMLLRLRADPSAEEGINGQTPLQMASNEGVRNELRRAVAQRSVGSKCPAPTGKPATAPSSKPEPAVPSEPAASSAAVAAATTAASAAAPAATASSAATAASAAAAAATAAPTATAAAVAAAAPAAAPSQGPHDDPVQVPGVFCYESPFQDLQSRFLKIMERVQEGGLEQLEHIKRPHLFNGSWMVDVDTHQKLLGRVLKDVPGPEVCLRVFNLLRPPRQFPASRGDERDIISYYSFDRGWPGDDAGCLATAVEPVKQMTRDELVRAIQDHRSELAAREAKVQELQQQVERLHAELVRSVDQQEARLLRERLEKAQAQLSTQSEALDESRREAHVLEGQVQGLTKQLKEAQQRASELFAERRCCQQQLEQTEFWRQGVERSQNEAMQSQLQWQLREAETERISTVAVRYELQTEVRLLREELLQRSAETAAELSTERTRSGIVEHQLNSETSCAKHWMGEAQSSHAELASEVHAARTALAAESNRWEAAAMEARAFQAELLVARQEVTAIAHVESKATREAQTFQSELLAAKQEATAIAQIESKATREAKTFQSELLAAKQEATAVSHVEFKVQQLEREKDEMDKHYRTLFSHYNLLGQLFLGNQQQGAVSQPYSPTQTVSHPGSPPQTVSQPCSPPQQHTAHAVSQPCFSSPPCAVQSVSQAFLHHPAGAATSPLTPPPLQGSAAAPLEQTLLSAGSAASTSPLLEGTSTWEPADGGVHAPLGEVPAAAAGLQTPPQGVPADVATAPAGEPLPVITQQSMQPPPQGLLRRQTPLEHVLTDPAAAAAAAGLPEPPGTQQIAQHAAPGVPPLGQTPREDVPTDAATVPTGGVPEPLPVVTQQPTQPQAQGLLRRQTPLEHVLADPAAAAAAAGLSEPPIAQQAASGTGQLATPGTGAVSLVVKINCAKSLRKADWLGQSDPYCICQVPGRPDSKFQTKTVPKDLNPVWNHEGMIKVCEAGDDLLFEVWDSDFGKKDDFLGKAKLLSSDFFPAGCERELPLQGAGVEAAFLSVSVWPASITA